MGLVNIGLEFLLRQQTDPVPVSIGIFLVYLSALSFVLIGIARHYRAEPPWIAMTAVWLVAILLVPVVFSMTYSSPARSILYQLPYFAIPRMFGVSLCRSGRRQPLHLLFIVLQPASAILHLLQPLFPLIVVLPALPQA